MSGNQVNAAELLRLGQEARHRVEETTDWRRVLIFRVLSVMLTGLHTTVALIALSRPELVHTGMIYLIVPGVACWTSASSAHLRSQRVVISRNDRLSWLPILPFLTAMILALFWDQPPSLWLTILFGVAATTLGLPWLLQAARRKASGSRTGPHASTRHNSGQPDNHHSTDWTLWVITLSLGALCTISASDRVAVWALPFLLVLPWFGWRGGRWPLPVFFGLAAAVTATYAAALLRGFAPAYSMGTSVPLGLLATACLAVPALLTRHRLSGHQR